MSQGRTRLPLATDDWERVWGDQLVRAIDQNLDAAFANTAVTPAGGGTVTSVAVSGGTTGITTSGSPITTSGTITLGGTLAVANGGTGATTAGTALTALGAAPIASPTFTGTVTIPAGASITGYATSGANSSITSLTGLTTPLSITQGGTGATNAPDARTNLGITGGGSVISVDVSGGTTGLTTSGGPITNSGTITIAGTLAIANGGTGATTAGTALTALGAAALASPALTGTPTSTTAAVDTATTQIATTSFVTGQAASVAPLINGTATVGTSLRYARQDHVHPTDTTRAPLASPTFTGTVTIPAGASITGYATSGANSNITSLTGLTTPLSVTQGGTGLTTTPTNGQIPIGNGSGYSAATLTAGSNITISNSAGGITIAATGGGGGGVTSVNVSGGTTGLTTSGGPITTSGTITLAGTLGVANGGTGATTLTANNVLLGNGTSAVQVVAPGANGNVLTSNGTTWTSAASAAPTTGTAGYAFTGNGASPATFQGFLQPGAGATTRTWQNKAADIVSVKDFGAVGNGSTNDTAAFESARVALGAQGGTIYVPPGVYLVTAGGVGAINAPIYILGAGREATIITVASQNAGDLFSFTFTGRGSGISALSIKYATQPTTSRAAVNIENATSAIVRDLYIEFCEDGVRLGNSQGSVVECVEMWWFRRWAINLNGNLNDVHLNELFLNGAQPGTTTPGIASIGIRGVNKAHGIMASQIEIIQCQRPIYLEGSNNFTDVFKPAYSTFVDLFFDSSADASILNYCDTITFVGVWFSNRATGLSLTNSRNIKFIGAKFVNNDQHGCIVEASNKYTEFQNCVFNCNSQGSSGTYSGLVFASGASDFLVSGGYFGNAGPFSSKQGYGIFLLGSNDRYSIRSATFDGNISSAIFGAGVSVSTTRIIDGCIGFATEATGNTQTTSPGTTVTVNHGLVGAPSSVLVTPTGSLGAATYFWVSGITSTQFVINLNADATFNVPFSWRAAL